MKENYKIENRKIEKLFPYQYGFIITSKDLLIK